MNTKLVLAAAAAAGALTVAGVALADTTMLPGYYETKTRSPGDPEVETVRDCVKAGEDRTVERLLKAALQDAACKYTQKTVGGGKFAIAGTCVQQGVKSSFKQTGTYTTTGFTLNMGLTMTMGGQTVKVDTISVSRRIAAACPAGAA